MLGEDRQDQKFTSNLKTMGDIRRMRRSINMRNQSPEEVAQTLDVILKEMVVLTSAKSGALSKRAMKELEQIRRSMVAGQINAGGKQAVYTGKISAVIDQVNKIEEKYEDINQSVVKDTFSTLKDSLPSTDAIVAAVMTGNPLIGYGVQIMRDLLTSRKNAKEKQKQASEFEATRQKELLALIEDEKVINDEKKKLLEDEKKDDGKLAELIKVREGIDKLVRIWDDETEETNNTLERIATTTDANFELEQEAADTKGLEEREAAFKAGDTGGLLSDVTGAKGGKGGLLGALGGLLLGGGGMLMKLLAPFTGLLTFLKVGGAKLLRLGKLSGILTIVMAVYDFIEGFFNAADILQKEGATIKERIAVGIASIFTGLWDVVAWVGGLFGADLWGGLSRDEATKNMAEFGLTAHEWATNTLTDIIEWSANLFDGIGKWIGEALFNVVDFITNPESRNAQISKWTTNITEVINNWYDKLTEAMSSIISDIVDTTINKIQEVFKDIQKLVEDYIPDFGIFSSEEDDENTRSILNPMRYILGKEIEDSPPLNNRVTRDIDEKIRLLATDNMGSGNNTVVAPNNQTNIHNASYSGSSNSENNEPTHRRFQNANSYYGY